MKLRELYEDGRIVKGVNTTPDIDTNSISKEAAKFGNKVDKDGRPPIINSKAAKNSTPNKLANLGLAESCFTPMEMAIMEGGHSIEDLHITESDLLVQQYSTSSLLKFFKKLSDLPVDVLLKKAIYKELVKRGVDLEEGVGSTLAKLGLVGAVAAGGAGAYNAAVDAKNAKDAEQVPQVVQAPAQDKKDLSKIEIPKQDKEQKASYKPFTNNKNELTLAKHAQSAGIKGVELAAFMSQMAHESENFTDMIEDISHERAAKKYGKGKIAKILGNKSENDAIRFKGRGYIQLTGRWNYEWMEKELGIDLTSSWSAAQKAADPDIAADIAVAYWKKRVQSKVSDFTDVRAVTKKINPGLHGLEARKGRFEKISTAMRISGDSET